MSNMSDMSSMSDIKFVYHILDSQVLGAAACACKAPGAASSTTDVGDYVVTVRPT